MIKIHFEEPSSEKWRMWIENCKKETEIINEERSKGTKKEYKNSLYKKMCDVFLSVEGPFHGKCAYCESCIAVDQPGDLDHYRPKGEVKDIDDKIVQILDDQGNLRPHPGYYWLAYDWRNLLPCCKDCNSTSKRKSKGKLVGKGSKFPVMGSYADCPGKEVDEQPLLINPVFEDPSNHIGIESSGMASGKTLRGEVSIEVLGLNIRKTLVSSRQRAFLNASESMLALFDAARPYESRSSSADSKLTIPEKKERVKLHLKILNDYLSGKAPYSAAGQAAINIECPMCQFAAEWLNNIYKNLKISDFKNGNITKPEGKETNSSHIGVVDRVFICPNCKITVPDIYVKISKDMGHTDFNCPCGSKVPLV